MYSVSTNVPYNSYVTTYLILFTVDQLTFHRILKLVLKLHLLFV